MKKYVPIYYVLGLIAMYCVVPTSLSIALVSFFGWNDITTAISMFSGVLLIISPMIYKRFLPDALLVIDKDQLINLIRDCIYGGELHFGWKVDINTIKSVKIVDKKEIKEYFDNSVAREALLIDFGENDFKYIDLTGFSKKQVKQIVKEIKRINPYIDS